MHRGYTPRRLQHACAQVARTPFSIPAFLLRHLTAIHPLLPTLSLSLFLPISRNDLFSVCVPGVCTHPVQWHRAASSTLSSTLPAAGSGPRENSFIVSSCRITPPRRRTSRSRNRIVDFRNCPVDDTRSLTR